MVCRRAQVMWGLALILAGMAAGGCSHGGRQTGAPHLFRDESEPSDGFQYYESATPAGEAGEKSGGGEASDSTIEVEVDEESADHSEGSAEEADVDAEEDTGDDEGDGGEDDDDGGEESAVSPAP